MGEGFSGTHVSENRGHMDKTKGVWKQGREVGLAGVGGKWRGVNTDN